MCSAYFVISCTVQRTEFTGLIKTCRKKITSFVFFYSSTHIQNDIADRDISSMQINCSYRRCFCVKGSSKNYWDKYLATFEILLQLKLADNSFKKKSLGSFQNGAISKSLKLRHCSCSISLNCSWHLSIGRFFCFILSAVDCTSHDSFPLTGRWSRRLPPPCK